MPTNLPLKYVFLMSLFKTLSLSLSLTLSQLMIDYGLDVTAPDRENMRPADWADATGQHSCTHYLLMYELCWQLSRDVSILTRDIEM